MVSIVDNARYPHAILLAPLIHTYRNALLGLFLPPDSPQLAPIERGWKLSRHVATHHRYGATLDAWSTVICHPDVFRPVETPQFCAAKLMRYYLRCDAMF